jgi:hypothetical protein
MNRASRAPDECLFGGSWLVVESNQDVDPSVSLRERRLTGSEQAAGDTAKDQQQAGDSPRHRTSRNVGNPDPGTKYQDPIRKCQRAVVGQ